MATYELVSQNPNSSAVGDHFTSAMLAYDAIVESGHYSLPERTNPLEINEFEAGKTTILVSPFNGRISIIADEEINQEKARSQMEETLARNGLRLESLPEFLTFGGGRTLVQTRR